MRPPPGYPFVGDLLSVPPPAGGVGRAGRGGDGELGERSPRSAYLIAFVLAFAGAMMGAGFMVVALVATEARRAAVHAEPMLLSTSEAPADPAESRVVDSPSPPSPEAPPIERRVPVFPARFLEGCSARDLDMLEHGLSTAIGKGAPLYNDGDIAGCVDVYDEAARDLQASLPPSCGGPVRALGEGRGTAGKLSQPTAKAWALRDAFDGLIEIMDRSRTGGVPSL